MQKSSRVTMNYYTAYEIGVDIEGSTQDYAMALLHIFNNAREFSDELLRVTNNSRNTIYVVCIEKVKKATIEYLRQFGKISSCYPVLIGETDESPDFDFEKYWDYIVIGR